MKGTILSADEFLGDLHQAFCQMRCHDGRIVYLDHRDLVWFNRDPETWGSETPETDEPLSQIAEIFVGREIEAVILNEYYGALVVGRKQLFPHPIEYLHTNQELVLEGTIVTLGDHSVKLRINWDKVVAESGAQAARLDKLAYLTGILPMNEFPGYSRPELSIGNRLFVNLGACDWRKQQLVFKPAML